jgi:hypothetical protein
MMTSWPSELAWDSTPPLARLRGKKGDREIT